MQLHLRIVVLVLLDFMLQHVALPALENCAAEVLAKLVLLSIQFFTSLYPPNMP